MTPIASVSSRSRRLRRRRALQDLRRGGVPAAGPSPSSDRSSTTTARSCATAGTIPNPTPEARHRERSLHLHEGGIEAYAAMRFCRTSPTLGSTKKTKVGYEIPFTGTSTSMPPRPWRDRRRAQPTGGRSWNFFVRLRRDLVTRWQRNLPAGWELVQLRRVAAVHNGADYTDVEVSGVGIRSTDLVASSVVRLHISTTAIACCSAVRERSTGRCSGWRFWTVDTMFYTELSPPGRRWVSHYYATTMPFGTTQRARPCRV